jgi:predicted phage terminase large subunit-like protein
MTPGCHGLLCRFLEGTTGIKEIDEAPIKKAEAPRGVGKSTMGTQARTIQRILQDPNVAILICNERLENCIAFLGAIKQEFQTNQLLQELFPEIIPDFAKTTWATDKIVVQRTTARREPTVMCIGVGGTVTGMHPDVIVVDDMLSREAAENARSGNADITGRTNRWIVQLKPLLNPWALPRPEILFIGTRWFAGDSYEYIDEAFGYGEDERQWVVVQKLPDASSQRIVLRRRGDVATFRRSAIEDGKSIWPENPDYSLESLAKLRLADPVLFAANYQNQPSDEITATFKDAWLRYFDWLDERTVRVNTLEGKPVIYGLQDLDLVMLVDPGGFAATRGGDRVRGSVLVTGTTPQLDHLILEAWSERVTYTEVMQRILTLATRYKVRRIGVEVAAQQAAFLDLLRRAAKDRGMELSFEAVKPESVQKEQRILVLEPYFQRGQVYVGRGAEFTEFREQYRTFPRGRRNDLLDALAYGPKLWKRASLAGPRSIAQRQQAERDAYYRRRGLTIQRN